MTMWPNPKGSIERSAAVGLSRTGGVSARSLEASVG